MSPRPNNKASNSGRRNVGSRGGDRRSAPQQPQENRFSAQKDHGLGGEQVEGRRAVRELLIADRRRVREVYIAQGMDESELVEEIIELCIERRVAVRQVGRTRIEQMAKSDAPQGVLAMAAPIPEIDLQELCATTPEGKPFLLAFDGVTDPHNLGSLIRTGECAGITGVILPKHRAVHITPTVTKASAGAVEHIPISVVTGLPTALTDLKQAGVWTVGLDPDGDTDINDLAVADQPVALVFGSEGAGLSKLTKQRCDVLANIPQFGSVASLNVAAAGAVACFAVARRRNA